MNKGILVVVSAPSGCGKDTVVAEVLKRMHGKGFLSVSMTTRPMRSGETEGVEYFFVSHDEFNKHINDGDMLEYAVYGDNMYGTPIKPVKDMLESGKTVFLIIEVEGGGNVKKVFPDATKIFIMPPSLAELERRLRGRGTDSEEAILKRLEIAKSEILRAEEYDFIVENDKLENAVEDVIMIINSQLLKTDKMKNKIKEVIENA